ncbi:MAG TPA: cyclic nucleotide-binding domain-containing protein [Gaiellaceae bacterium]
MSPRHVPATVHELTRVALLAGLPGETLATLARRMTREEFPAGAMIVREGEDDDRFYVVLNGIVAATTESLGPRRVLRPGEYFGEVAAALGVPRTATIHAMSPVTVASCDRETFEELVRPLFAD